MTTNENSQQIADPITACIDGSANSAAVCDAAGWAAGILNAPVNLIHILEKQSLPDNSDLSGTLGMDGRDQLLEKLASLDSERARLAMEHGKQMLADAEQRIKASGELDITTLQRHGNFVEEIRHFEKNCRLFVIGRRGIDHAGNSESIGSQLENMVRVVHTPVLVTIRDFNAPLNYMIAFDGSNTATRAIERIATSPLLVGLKGHIVMIGENTESNQDKLSAASKILTDNNHQIDTHLLQGSVVEQLEKFQADNQIELKVMGAYGHSRIREFFVGSNTSKMIMRSPVPILLLR